MTRTGQISHTTALAWLTVLLLVAILCDHIVSAGTITNVQPTEYTNEGLALVVITGTDLSDEADGDVTSVTIGFSNEYEVVSVLSNTATEIRTIVDPCYPPDCTLDTPVPVTVTSTSRGVTTSAAIFTFLTPPFAIIPKTATIATGTPSLEFTISTNGYEDAPVAYTIRTLPSNSHGFLSTNGDLGTGAITAENTPLAAGVATFYYHPDSVPNPGQELVDAVTIEGVDNSGADSVKTILFLIYVPPKATSDTVQVEVGEQSAVELRSSGVEGTPQYIITAIPASTFGTVRYNGVTITDGDLPSSLLPRGNNVLVFVAAAGATAGSSATLEFRVEDAYDTSDPAAVTLTLFERPSVTPQSLDVEETATLSITIIADPGTFAINRYRIQSLPPSGVLKDQDGVELTVAPINLPGPMLTYEPETIPDGQETIQTSFEVTVVDVQGYAAQTASIAIEVFSGAEADDLSHSASLTEGSVLELTFTANTGAYITILTLPDDGATVLTSSDGLDDHGVVIQAGDRLDDAKFSGSSGSHVFVTAGGDAGTTTFTYQVTDVFDTSPPATVTITKFLPVTAEDAVEQTFRSDDLEVTLRANPGSGAGGVVDKFTITSLPDDTIVDLLDNGVKITTVPYDIVLSTGPPFEYVLVVHPMGEPGTVAFTYVAADANGVSSEAIVTVSLVNEFVIENVVPTQGPAYGGVTVLVSGFLGEDTVSFSFVGLTQDLVAIETPAASAYPDSYFETTLLQLEPNFARFVVPSCLDVEACTPSALVTDPNTGTLEPNTHIRIETGQGGDALVASGKFVFNYNPRTFNFESLRESRRRGSELSR